MKSNLTRKAFLFLTGASGIALSASCKKKETYKFPWEGGSQTEDALYGYIDTSGSLVITPQFVRASSFNNNGYAVVDYKQESPYGQTNRWSAIIDTNGAFTCKPTTWSEFHLNSNTIIRKDDGLIDDIDRIPAPKDYERGEAKYGAVDAHGVWRSQDRYKSIDYYLGSYKDIYFMAEKDDESKGIANPDGGWLFDPVYGVCIIEDALNYFEISHSLAVYDLKATGVGWIDESGSWIIEPHDNYSRSSYFNAFGIAGYTDTSGLWGLISSEGEEILTPTYHDLMPIYSSELFIAQKDKKGPYGLIDKYGVWQIEPVYEKIKAQVAASNPLIGFQSRASKLCGFASSPENIIESEAHFEAINIYKGSLSLYPAQDSESHLWGFVDEKSSWTISPSYKEAYGFYSGLAAVKSVE